MTRSSNIQDQTWGKGTTRLIIVIPTLNERKSLPVLLPRIFAAVPAAEVLVVDDNSPDGTATWVEAEAKREPRLHLLRRIGPRGLGRAYIAGFDWVLARGSDMVAQMDADGSHDPAFLPAMIDALTTSDVVIGTRYAPGGMMVNWPWYRQALSRSAGIYVRVLTNLPSTDPTSGFRCFRANALAALQPATLKSEGYAFQVEVLHRAWRQGVRIAECAITFTEREQGYSKLSGLTIWEAIRLGVRLGRERLWR
jgi:dolichol-phosphate mannosyltransferase